MPSEKQPRLGFLCFFKSVHLPYGECVKYPRSVPTWILDTFSDGLIVRGEEIADG